jgi:hypothetical protein
MTPSRTLAERPDDPAVSQAAPRARREIQTPTLREAEVPAGINSKRKAETPGLTSGLLDLSLTSRS